MFSLNAKKELKKRRYYSKKEITDLIYELKCVNLQLIDINQNYITMNSTLNSFTKIICQIDDEMRFIRNLINFGGNKAQKLEKKGK